MSELAWRPSDDMLERIRGIADGTVAPVQPRNAATVVLVRDADAERSDGSGRLEVFLLRRVATMAFGAGMHVFPGGLVDPTDDTAAPLPDRWAELLAGGDHVLLRAIVGAALRETIEEAGVRLDPLTMVPFAHWVTPEPEPRRYDTRFFLAVLPGGEQARIADGEADRGSWLAPGDAAGLPLMPPTRVALADLAECADTAAALARQRRIIRVAPRLVLDGDRIRLVLADP